MLYVLVRVSLFLVGKRPADWISKMEAMNWADALIERLDLMAEIDALAEQVETNLTLLEGFDLEPIEFEPYDDEGTTTYGKAN